jgi:hypothetical protein
MRTKLLTLLALLGVIAAFSGSLQADAVIYEPFDYEVGGLAGQGDDANSVGLTGTWSPGFDVSTGSLSYGSLPTSGNQAVISGKSNATISVGTTLSDAGLLADNSTLWFSVLWKTGSSGGSNPDQAFALGTDPLKGSTNNNVPMENSGAGIGFTLKGETDLRAVNWSNGAVNRPTDGLTNLDLDTTYLIVGEIIWASDTINLYLPGTDLVQTTAVATHTIALDQSTFDVVTFSAKSEGGGVDEIRFGDGYGVVIGERSPSNFYPKDGSSVPLGDVELSWTNITAAADIDDLYE